MELDTETTVVCPSDYKSNSVRDSGLFSAICPPRKDSGPYYENTLTQLPSILNTSGTSGQLEDCATS